MDFIHPQHRLQVTFGSLEEAVETDNPVRLIDAENQTLINHIPIAIGSVYGARNPAYCKCAVSCCPIVRLVVWGSGFNYHIEKMS
jgi:hypothetical protein